MKSNCISRFWIACVCVFIVPSILAQQGPKTTEDREKLVVEDFFSLGINLEDTIDKFDTIRLRRHMSEVLRWANAPQAAQKTDDLDKAAAELFPSRWERWARFHQLQVIGSQQPRTIIELIDGTLTPKGNPDYALWKFSATLKTSEFFPTAQDVASTTKTFVDAGGALSDLSRVLCRVDLDFKVPAKFASDAEKRDFRDGHIARCLNKSRKRDFFYRILSGTSGIVSFAQNPQVQQNIRIPAGSDVAAHNKALGGQLSFDPTSLFMTGTDWRSGQETAGLYGDRVRDKYTRMMKARCKQTESETALPFEDDAKRAVGSSSRRPPSDPRITSECVERLAGPTGVGKKLLAALFPQIDFRQQTQFDFIRTGGGLVQPPYPQSHLWTLTFTADLRKAFVASKSRVDAMVALSNKQVKPPEVKDITEIKNPKKAAVVKVFQEMATSPWKIDDDSWFKAARKSIEEAFWDQTARYVTAIKDD